MSEATRQVEVAESFIRQLADFERFLGRGNPAAGRAFTAAVFNFCYDILASSPWAYPAFRDGQKTWPTVRRAVFRRHYVVLYEVTDTAVQLLDIFHTSQRDQRPTSFEAEI